MKRNSLLELFRFLFAISILYYHDYFIIKNTIPNNNFRCGVFFFFLISGYFLNKMIEKFLENNKDNKKWFYTFIKKRIIKFGIPTLIAYLCGIIETIITKAWLSGVMHYLWYIHALVMFEVGYLLLKKLIKNEKVINIVLIISIVVSTSLRFIPSLYNISEINAFTYIPIGILISKIKFKEIPQIYKTLITILTVGLYSYMVVIENSLAHELTIGLLLILMFTAVVKTNIKEVNTLNTLGKLSLSIYVYQSVPRLIGIIINKNFHTNHSYMGFIIIFGMVIITEILKIVYSLIKNKNSIPKDIQATKI